MRWARRETFRAPVFLWITPLETPRMISGSAALSATCADFLSPEAIASSTLRVKVRARPLRAWLMSARFLLVRTRFLAEAILGMRLLVDFLWEAGLVAGRP